MPNPPESVHHLVPVSAGGAKHDDRNRKRIRHNLHVAFHVVFDNLPPDEQLARLIDLNAPVLRREFRDKAMRLLGKGEDWIYEDGIYVRR